MTDQIARRSGAALLILLGLVAGGADRLATHDPAAQFTDFVLAPPMPPHIIDASGAWQLPFVYPLQLEDRLRRRYSTDATRMVTLRWFRAGTLATTDGDPWFPLGTDASGRDVFARMVLGARLSLSVAALAAITTLLIGALVGGIAGVAGGPLDTLLMKGSDFVLALPSIYVAMTLRAVLPLNLSTPQVFWSMTLVLAAVAWPIVARGVRAIVSGENRKEYAEAARAGGATGTRVLLRHLLPAASGFLGVQATLLVPAFVTAEATLSYVGLGFKEAAPSWGVMLKEASEAGMFDAPWLLAPAIAIALTVLAINLTAGFGRAGTQPAVTLK